jgi:zinc/manganese transport system substrate-binding protein
MLTPEREIAMHRMDRTLLALAAICITALAGAAPAHAALQVVTAVPELADITSQVGGSLVSVYSIAKPNQDYHMIEPRPSDVSRIAKAGLVVRIGMDLDLWMDALINASGNRKVARGGAGYVDASEHIAKLEVPKGQITGASGDIHVYGNPHYFYDPVNAKWIAYSVAQGLARVLPASRGAIGARYKTFCASIDKHMVGWAQALAPYKGRSVVTYHESAIYFLRRFGLRQFGTLEVKPGIPPSAAHVRNIINQMKTSHVKALAIESVYSRQFADLVVREAGAKLVITPYSVGSLGTKDYFGLIDMWVQKYCEALR